LALAAGGFCGSILRAFQVILAPFSKKGWV
jgi:hypothetical protein